ncbi:MAG: S41 family peptidase [Chitinophagaceae bacterium]
MKLLPCIVATLAISTIATAQTTFNLDMEELNASTGLPANWTVLAAKGYKIQTDSQTVQHGHYSFLIERTEESAEYGANSFLVKSGFGGKKLVLTGYVKTVDVTGYAGLWMRVDGRQGMFSVDNMEDRGIKGTSDWKKYTITLNYDEEEATQVYLGGVLVGGGKMWIDNLELTIDGTPIAQAPPKKQTIYKGRTDTAFSTGSGIETITLNKQATENLVNLGQLWGFLKYHHPAIAAGNYNWDAELFRVLPGVLAAKNKNEANAVMEKWVDALGKPDSCTSCKPTVKDSTVKILPDYGSLLTPGNFNTSLINKLTYIRNNRNQGKSYYISMMPGVGNPEFKNENTYAKMQYPDAGYRLLALYRYWNMIQYFFPYKDVIGEDWAKVLPAFIPTFVNARDTVAYSLACLTLIAKVNDTHANVWGNNAGLNRHYGKYYPPVQTKFIENKLVVTGFYTEADSIQQQLKKGDVITKVNNRKIEDLVKELLPQTPASNYETQQRDLPLKILRGTTDGMELEIERNTQRSKLLVHRYEGTRLKMGIDYAAPDSSYKLINGNIGYIYPGKYKNNQLPEIKKRFKDAKAIIVDMRCYPSEFMPFTFGSYLKPALTPFVKFTKGDAGTPGLFTETPLLQSGGENGDHYTGKVIVIVNATSQSQAEYTTMAFQSAPNTIVLGSTTAGADGNVSAIYLPGNIFTYISGIGVFYPDGRPTQRVGVHVDVPMKPSIRGILDGRDELLEKAIELAEKGESSPAKKAF